MGSSHRELINKYREDQMPRERTYELQDQGDVVRMTLMADALDSEGVDRSGQVTQAYYEREGVVVIDLREGQDD